MEPGGDENLIASEEAGLWYPTAVRAAVVAGVFCVIVAALLGVNYVQRTYDF
ncbi:MAG: hypothetical protein ACYS76_09990 [Planctomycetota bacterium]|jgi:hypothetical protein